MTAEKSVHPLINLASSVISDACGMMGAFGYFEVDLVDDQVRLFTHRSAGCEAILSWSVDEPVVPDGSKATDWYKQVRRDDIRSSMPPIDLCSEKQLIEGLKKFVTISILNTESWLLNKRNEAHQLGLLFPGLKHWREPLLDPDVAQFALAMVRSMPQAEGLTFTIDLEGTVLVEGGRLLGPRGAGPGLRVAGVSWHHYSIASDQERRVMPEYYVWLNAFHSFIGHALDMVDAWIMRAKRDAAVYDIECKVFPPYNRQRLDPIVRENVNL